MKYVIFKGAGMFFPVIFNEGNVHSLVKMQGAEAVSAGFCYVNELGIIEVMQDQESESLGLKPDVNDCFLLRSLLLNLPLSNFIDHEKLEVLDKTKDHE